jgi:maltose O-acetyltransferase
VSATAPAGRTEKQKMLAGELYRPDDAELQRDMAATAAWLRRLNAAADAGPAERRAILAEHLGAVGEGVVLRSPFFCDYGFNITIGAGSFLNFNCVILDVAAVTIGAGVQIGPAVQIYAADHPREPGPRRDGLEFGRPVAIGDNVWIGGGAILVPGVRVGADAVIGAGSVVTRDVPAGATAFGNPARVKG